MAILDYTGLTRYDKKAKALLADVYSTSSTYAVGDVVLDKENGSLYKCILPVTTPGAWSASNWQAITVDDELSVLKGAITSNADAIGRIQSRRTRLTDFNLSDLQAAVADQSLEKHGLKVGDKKTINGYTYVIAGLNVMKGTHGYTCTSNHVGLIVIPHTTCAWNASGNTYTGADSRGAGYLNSDLHYYLKNTVLPHAKNDLGSDHLYLHKKLMSNAINQTGYNRFGTNSGCASGWTWSDEYISALTEAQVYGGDHWSSSGYDTGEANTLLPVFQEFKHTDLFENEYPWLRNVSSASQACSADDNGNAGGDFSASYAFYVAGLILYH